MNERERVAKAARETLDLGYVYELVDGQRVKRDLTQAEREMFQSILLNATDPTNNG